MRNPQDGVVFPYRQISTIAPLNRTLNVSRAGFIYRGTALFNQLPLSLRTCTDTDKFKREAKEWTLVNVEMKPT